MEKLEETLIKNNPQVKFYCRFVDDICMVIRERQTKNVLKLLNSFDRNVQFTYEVEIDNKLPFLDVLLHKEEDGTLKFSIYRKGTHTDKYLDWYSCHPKAHKITVVNTLIQRALRICDNEFLEDADLQKKNHGLFFHIYQDLLKMSQGSSQDHLEIQLDTYRIAICLISLQLIKTKIYAQTVVYTKYHVHVEVCTSVKQEGTFQFDLKNTKIVSD